ncbi:hypothetical protein SNE40_012292 [Patella caerulea]|uniref:DNA excision repair protein ERCC-6-like 2 n=1 Tax=Patella caerulea TaxID=87958 RepID=A0AAN8JRB7_PATCE
MTDDIVSFSNTTDITEKPQKVLSKGDECCVTWPGDGQTYNGRIKKLRRCLESNKIYALVTFDNFEKEDDEEFNIKEIQERVPEPSPARKKKTGEIKKGLFQPLTGIENNKRLEEKYGGLDDLDDEFTERSTSREEKTTPRPLIRRKPSIVTGGSSKSSTSKQKKSNASEPKPSARQVESEVTKTANRNSTEPKPSTSGRHVHVGSQVKHTNSKNSTFEIDDDNEILGFTEDDLEKPVFTIKPSAAKVPFILSGNDDKSVVQVPAAINQYLRDYQRDGIRFLYRHYKDNKGAILGDDMGLGKTVQVIGFLAALLNKQGNRVDVLKQKPSFIRKLSDTEYIDDKSCTSPFLIIGPGSVLYNWLDELETWGYFSVGKYHGVDKERCLTEILKGKFEIVVTTFETFRENMKGLCRVDWEAVIVDEVHRIKDVKSLTTKALRKIPTNRRYGLTGTALQNNMTELWSLLDWAQPDILGSVYEFTDNFVKPIEKGQRVDSTKRELAEARKLKEKFSEMRNAMMIRRMKTLIADQLPEKDDNVVFCKLSHLQTSVYKAILNHPDLQLVLKSEDPCTCGSDKSRGTCCYKESSDGMTVQGLKFSFMHLLMKVANHVALLIPGSNTSRNQNVRAREICATALKDHQEFINLKEDATFRTLSDPKYCGKMKILEGLLQVFYKTHCRVLIFSLSTKLLDILEQYLISSCYEFRRIDGSVSNKKRMELVREFNKSPNIFIFLISTKAGGLGLNLTGANRVVIFDPNWNPSHDLQAQDRAYRIGQRLDVKVYRLISAGTIEENVYLRQIYKQQLGNVAISAENAKRLFHGVQGNKHKQGELFGIKNMFQLRTGESCLTMDILERNSKVEAGLKGYDMTKYIPSVYETQDSSNDIEEDKLDLKRADSSTDSDTFHDLFDSNDESEMVTKTTKKSEKSPVAGPSKTSSVKVRKDATRQLKKKSSVTDEPLNQSFASIGDVLGQSQVLHIHENVNIIGASKAEDYMSRCAIQEVYELHQNSQVPAAHCDPLSEPSSDEDPLPKKRLGRKSTSKTEPDHNTPKILHHDSTNILLGQTPTAIKRKHFEKLAEFKDGRSLIELAVEIVESCTEDRLKLLKSFYIAEHPELQEILSDAMTIQPSTDARSSSTPSRSKQDKVKLINKSTIKSGRIKAATPGRKRTVPGVSFLDPSLSDSTTLESTMPSDTNPSIEESSLEVGLKPSPFKQRRIQQSNSLKLKSAKRKNVRQTLEGSAKPSTSAILDTCEDDLEMSQSDTESEQRSTKIIGPSWLLTEGILYDNMVVIKPNKTSNSSDIVQNSKTKSQKESKPNKLAKVKREVAPTSMDDLLAEMAASESLPNNEDIEFVNSKLINEGGKTINTNSTNSKQNKNKATNSNIEIRDQKRCKSEEKTTKTVVKDSRKVSKCDYKSVLNEFLLNDSSDGDEPSQSSPRKTSDDTKSNSESSPDKKSQFKRKKRSTDDLFADWDNFTSCSEGVGDSETSILLNNSTLKDDAIDCFTDPRKWKKKPKVKLGVTKTVEKFLQESDDDYEKLFKSGKMRKRVTEPESVNQNEDLNNWNPNNTPSLFS